MIAEKAYDRIFSKLRAHVEEFGRERDWLEAAAEVESELRTEAEHRIDRALGLKVFAGKYSRAAQQAAEAERKQGAAKVSQRRTITNRSVTRGAPEDDPLPLDPDARDKAIRKRFFSNMR